MNYKEDAKKPFNLAEVALFITYLFKVLLYIQLVEMNWSYLNIQTFLIAIIAALDAQTLLVLFFWPPFEYTHFMSLNICIIPIIPLSSPASLVMVGS